MSKFPYLCIAEHNICSIRPGSKYSNYARAKGIVSCTRDILFVHIQIKFVPSGYNRKQIALVETYVDGGTNAIG